MLKKRAVLFFLLLPSLCVAVNSSKDILERKLQLLGGMKAQFSQTILKKGRLKGSSEGNMAVRRPDQFRWETVKPYKQEIIADGKVIWVYDKDLKQVTIREQTRGASILPAALLSGNTKQWLRRFRIAQQGSTFILQPRNRSNDFLKVILRFNGNKMVEMRLEDRFDQITVLRFHDMQVGRDPEKRLFQFRVPSDVDVIRR